jgi:hypothetical protein
MPSCLSASLPRCLPAKMPGCLTVSARNYKLTDRRTQTDTHTETERERERGYRQKNTQKKVRGERERRRDYPQSLYGEVELSAKLGTHTTTFTVNYLKKILYLDSFFFSANRGRVHFRYFTSLWAKPFKYFGPAI